jgi:hypothetical protein
MRYSEIIEAVENDDDMFGAPGTLATGAKQAIKQIEEPYLRTVRRVRDLAKTGFGIKTRVSSVPKSASRGRATFWFGDYVTGPGGRAPKPLPVAQEIKAELERQGFECKFTGSGWLSVLVPPTYSDLLREENDESDDDLFADRKSSQLAGFFAEQAKDYHALADEALAYADRFESDANSYEEVSNAFRVGMESGIAAFRGLDIMLRANVVDEIADQLDFDINELAYPEDLDESDYWTEGAAELEEPPERPRKTTTKTKPDTKFDIPFQQDQDSPLTDPLDDLKKKAGVGGNKPEVNLRKASQKDTLSKTSGLGTSDMGDMLGRMRDIELDKDLEAYPDQDPGLLPSVEVNTQNLPAVAGQALQAAGVQNPEFHQVSNLPGNMADQIRQLGKSLFGSLTMTPTKRIHVVANLGGKGPNSTQEVNAVAGFLKQHGDDRGPGDIDFEQVMPGYKAQTHMYTAAGIRWMLVKDFAGQYIYCWPEEDSHDASPGLEHDELEMKQLR